MNAKLLQHVPWVTNSSRHKSLGHPTQSLLLLQMDPDMSTAMHKLKFRSFLQVSVGRSDGTGFCSTSGASSSSFINVTVGLLEGLKEGFIVVGGIVGGVVGGAAGLNVGFIVGLIVGFNVGFIVGFIVEDTDGGIAEVG